MPVNKAYTNAMAKKHFGKELFDMCWSTEAEAVPIVETSTATSLAKPQYSGQTFEMCWDIEPEPAPTVKAPVKASVNALAEASSAQADYGGQDFNMCWDTNTTLAMGRYDLCWDEPSSSKVASVPAINVEAATPPATTAYDLCWDEEPRSSMADQYDVCQGDRPAASAAEYQGGFDMCWDNPPVVGDDDHEDHPTATPTTSLGKSAVSHLQSTGSQDTWASLAPSSAPTEGSMILMVEAGEELVHRANERLERLQTMMRGNDSKDAADILQINQGLIARYQFTHNEYVTSTNDIAKIQHMLQMFRQIDDPLTVLELGMKKAAG